MLMKNIYHFPKKVKLIDKRTDKYFINFQKKRKTSDKKTEKTLKRIISQLILVN